MQILLHHDPRRAWQHGWRLQCGMVQADPSNHFNRALPCLACHSHDPTHKQLCRLQMDLERRYAAVLHKVVRRINGKLAVVLQHLLAMQQRNEEDGPTLPQRLAPVLDMYKYVCGCKALCMSALLQHLAAVWCVGWHLKAVAGEIPIACCSASRQLSCLAPGHGGPASQRQAQPTGSVHAKFPLTTVGFISHRCTADAKCSLYTSWSCPSLCCPPWPCSAQFEWMNAAKVDVRVYRRLTRELWNAAAAVSSAASPLTWKASTCLPAILPALLLRCPAVTLALQGDAGGAPSLVSPAVGLL